MHLFCLQREPIITIGRQINLPFLESEGFNSQQIKGDCSRCCDGFVFNLDDLI